MDQLTALRKHMREHNLQAYIIPSNDPHQSEYVAEHWEARSWISGFTGSAGTVVVTADHAGLWTDSPYFIQAEQELEGSPIVLHKLGIPHTPEHIGWLCQSLESGSTVGIDGRLLSIQAHRHLRRRLSDADLNLATEYDLIDRIWSDRPALPDSPIFEHPLTYQPHSRAERISLLQKHIREQNADFILLSTLDDIAWLLHLRGTDVPYNPVFLAYLLLGQDTGLLFVDTRKVDQSLKDALQADGIFLQDYFAIDAYLKNLASDQRILLDPASTSVNHYELLEQCDRKLQGQPVRDWKAIKSEQEVEHIRRAMCKDGVALLRLYRWLLGQHDQGKTPTEYELSVQLARCRAEQQHYQGESFPAIVGYQANGAIVHYRAKAEGSAKIQPSGLLLLDSGGQYLDGTTDITRTFPMGAVTEQQRRDYTLVLKGHIALATSRFPAGTSCVQLDTLARAALWEAGINYGHGTGHGVGYFLNVHEPPQSISPNANSPRTRQPMRVGMLTSNEPGCYREGAYGIRIENLILCVADEKTDFGPFLRFETLTLFPIDNSLIEISLMQESELTWLNDYHQRVFSELEGHLDPEERIWLEAACAPLHH